MLLKKFSEFWKSWCSSRTTSSADAWLKAPATARASAASPRQVPVCTTSTSLCESSMNMVRGMEVLSTSTPVTFLKGSGKTTSKEFG